VTDRDLTAIVETVARAEYERNRAGVADDHPMHDMPWESLPPFTRHAWREEVLPVVTATIAALDAQETPPELGQAFPGLQDAVNMLDAITVTPAATPNRAASKTPTEILRQLFAYGAYDEGAAISMALIIELADDDDIDLYPCPECYQYDGHTEGCVLDICGICGRVCTCDRDYERGAGR